MKYTMPTQEVFKIETGFDDMPELIDVSISKLKHYWLENGDGKKFYDEFLPHAPLKDAHNARVGSWVRCIEQDGSIGAPVIVFRGEDPTKFIFISGRHRFEAFARTGHKCIRICVPKTKAGVLKELLGGFKR